MLTTVDHYAPETVFADARHAPESTHPRRARPWPAIPDSWLPKRLIWTHWSVRYRRWSQLLPQVRESLSADRESSPAPPAGKPRTGMSLNALLSGRSRTLP
jgi:hypothetical protein